VVLMPVVLMLVTLILLNLPWLTSFSASGATSRPADGGQRGR
jgi:hypothetical protein